MINIPNKTFSKIATNSIIPVVREVLWQLTKYFILQTELKVDIYNQMWGTKCNLNS